MILTMNNITKSFGTTRALRGVDLKVRKGEVHALIGENGAGKSTLMKILSGALRPDSGSVTLKGDAYNPASPHEARNMGVSMVYQELALAPHLTVQENIILGWEKHSSGVLRAMKREVSHVYDFLEGVLPDPFIPVGQVGISGRQMTEIGRALLQNSSIIVMDEPTSSLSPRESATLFKVIDKLRNKGITIIYISHFLEEVKKISDSYTVLRDGHAIVSKDTASSTIPEIIEAMIGREVKDLYPQSGTAPGAEVFSFHIEAGGHKSGWNRGLEGSIHFSVKEGEVMGISGLVGSGRTELLKSLCGLNGKVSGVAQTMGSIGNVALGDIDQRQVSFTSITPARALKMGYGMLSEDRAGEGVALSMSISDNLTLPNLKDFVKYFYLQLRRRARYVNKWAGRLNIFFPSLGVPVSALSGGNQQKVALGRLLQQDLKLLLLDEPTRGVDVGAKSQIYALIHDIASRGTAVIIVSSYLPELMGICSTLCVMHKGKLSEKCPVSEWTAESVMDFATRGRESQ